MLYIANKTKHFKMGVSNAVLKCSNCSLKLCTNVKTNVLKCKACLKVKFKCIPVTIYSLVMNSFSCDLIPTEID